MPNWTFAEISRIMESDTPRELDDTVTRREFYGLQDTVGEWIKNKEYMALRLKRLEDIVEQMHPTVPRSSRPYRW